MTEMKEEEMHHLELSAVTRISDVLYCISKAKYFGYMVITNHIYAKPGALLALSPMNMFSVKTRLVF